MPKRISVSSAWRITVDKDLAHRRLNVAQLTTLISHRTVRFSPRSGSAVARGAQGWAGSGCFLRACPTQGPPAVRPIADSTYSGYSGFVAG